MISFLQFSPSRIYRDEPLPIGIEAFSVLDKVDLSLKMDREDFETGMPELENDLARLQRLASSL